MNKKVKEFLTEQKVLLVLLILCTFMGIYTDIFFTKSNIEAVLVQVAIYGITACGMTFAIIGGDFDLSVGSTMALTGLLCVMLEPLIGQIPAILLALLCACAVGAFNGFLIAKCKINSFIVTIGTMYIVKGIALRISDGRPVQSNCPWYQLLGTGKIGGLPIMVLVLVVCVISTAYVLRQTRFGRNVYTIGGNSEVAHNSGINVVKCKIFVFVLCSFFAGIAGILNSAKLNTGSATHGETLALSVITGTVIGGTSLVGGVGGIGKTMVGILIFNVLTNALNILHVYSYYQMVIRGILLVVIIAFEAYQVHRKHSY